MGSKTHHSNLPPAASQRGGGFFRRLFLWNCLWRNNTNYKSGIVFFANFAFLNFITYAFKIKICSYSYCIQQHKNGLNKIRNWYYNLKPTYNRNIFTKSLRFGKCTYLTMYIILQRYLIYTNYKSGVVFFA